MSPREEIHLPVPSRSFYSYVFISLLACTGDGQLIGVNRSVNSSEPPIISLSADKQTYAPGDTIKLTLGLRNDSDDPLVLDFVTGQRYDFAILRTREDTVWSWSRGKAFTQVLGQETVQPDQGLVYSERIRPELPLGTFHIHGRIVARNNTLADSTVIIIQ
jgi:hypothetical protein